MRKGDAITGEVSFEQYQRDLNVRFSYKYESSSANGVNETNGFNGVNAVSGFGLYKVYVSTTTVFIIPDFGRLH